MVKKIGQQEIADRLGIARSTVTRVLRHDPTYRAAPETRKLILKTMREMGYKLRRRTTGNVAFVVCGEFASMQSELHLATCEKAAESDYRVFLVRMPENPSYKALSLYVNPLSADGAIIIGEIGRDVLEQFAEIVPVVCIDGKEELSEIDTVTVDYAAMGAMLTRRMIELGHERIAVVTQFPEDVGWNGPLAGFKREMDAAGQDADLGMVWYKSRKRYPLLLKEILSREPTALLAVTSSDHAIILSTLMAMGVDVPGDLSYVGWAYSYSAALIPYPQITCLEDIYQSVVESALRRLFLRIEDPAVEAERIIAPVRLRVGETCVERRPGR